MTTLRILGLLVLASPALLHADVHIKQKLTHPPFMGQPGKETITEQWLGTNKMAATDPDQTTIIDAEAKKFFMVYHKKKNYVEASLPLDMTKIMPEEMAQMMKGMIAGMTGSVQANGQTKKIGNWNAKGYDCKITMMGMDMKMVFWASTDVPFDWKKYQPLYSEMTKTASNMSDKMVEELKKIEGYPVQTDMAMMGMVVTVVTQEIAEKAPPPGIYSVPAGYTKTARLSMQDMQK